MSSNKAAVLQLLEPRIFLYGDENGAAAELPMHGVDMVGILMEDIADVFCQKMT